MKTSRKNEVLGQLKRTPIVQVTCEKLGIARATFYRWKKKDKEFADAVDTALEEGSHLINDMAESQLITAIKNSNMTAIIFWLKNHHKKYSPKLEVTTKSADLPLTGEQKETIKRSLNMAFAINKIKNNENEEKSE